MRGSGGDANKAGCAASGDWQCCVLFAAGLLFCLSEIKIYLPSLIRIC
jgi:hypothetical protein